MAEATNQQVQAYCDNRIRVRMEQVRALVENIKDDQASIADIYANVNDPASTFADGRTDGPPHLLAKSDVLSYNAFTALFLKCLAGTAITADVQQLAANLPVCLLACVRPLQA